MLGSSKFKCEVLRLTTWIKGHLTVNEIVLTWWRVNYPVILFRPLTCFGHKHTKILTKINRFIRRIIHCCHSIRRDMF